MLSACYSGICDFVLRMFIGDFEMFIGDLSSFLFFGFLNNVFFSPEFIGDFSGDFDAIFAFS